MLHAGCHVCYVQYVPMSGILSRINTLLPVYCPYFSWISAGLEKEEQERSEGWCDKFTLCNQY